MHVNIKYTVYKMKDYYQLLLFTFLITLYTSCTCTNHN